MPKRKRTTEETVEEKIAQFRKELHHALKLSKGFERQRQAKRLKDPKAAPEKVQRIQKEIVVLKSLDLHQAAHAHLCASLLKIKPVAESPNLPLELRNGPPKPDISEEERTALHNVTSSLYGRKEVKQVLEKAIPAICDALGVHVPSKKDKAPAKDARREKEEQPADRDSALKEGAKAEKKAKRQVKETAADEISDEEVEEAIARAEALLGGSSDEDSGSEGADEEDPMQVTSGEEDADDGFGGVDLDSEEGEKEEDETSFGGFSSDEDGGAQVEDDDSDDEDEGGASAEEEEEDSDHSAISRSPSPKRSSKRKRAVDTSEPTGSTFLPSLMGGYISGSESASDVDIEPPRKNRRGQRARQAIWEKKYKQEARHLSKPARDQGWDPKRGAVEGAQRAPWKRGIANPFARPAEGGDAGAGQQASRPAAPKKDRTTDNAGPLHPSWEAKKKAEEKQKNATFQGKKIKFE